MMKRVKAVTLVRAFFAGAMVSAAAVELVTSMPPMGQLTLSAVFGILSAAGVKLGAAAVA